MTSADKRNVIIIQEARVDKTFTVQIQMDDLEAITTAELAESMFTRLKKGETKEFEIDVEDEE